MAVVSSIEASQIQFGFDIASAITKEIRFLQKVNKYPCLYGGPVVRRAIERYERFWLPLAAKNPSIVLTAPLDIAWVWHCHMLAPAAYNQDCEKLVGCLINHKLTGTQEMREKLDISQRLWAVKYPTEPFFVDLKDTSVSEESDFESTFSYNLEEAVSRQKVFYYQVSLPHYLDVRFQRNCASRYQKFVYVKRQNPDMFIVPCYDIDVAWHTHIVHPYVYKSDTERILGKLFNHDDSVNDRSPDSRLSNADAETRVVWREIFDEDFSCYGAMYRGEPPNGKLVPVPKEEIFRISSKRAEFNISTIHLESEALSAKNINHLKLFITFVSGMEIEMLKLKKPKSDNTWSKVNCKDLFYDVDTNCCEYVSIHITQKASMMKKITGHQPAAVTGRFRIEDSLRKCVVLQEQCDDEIQGTLSDGSVLTINQDVVVKSIGTCVLRLTQGPFKETKLPEDFEQMWGPVPLPRIPRGHSNSCSMASHTIRTMKGDDVFTCRVIHSAALLTSVIQILYNDKMAVVSHLVGLDQFPLSTQLLNKNCVTLNPGSGERAFLIKNNVGDWAVVSGRWVGMKRGLGGVRGNNGQLDVQLFKLHNNKRENFIVKRSSVTEDFILTVGETEINFTKGIIQCASNHNDVAEQLALAFSVSVLHVICQPRPRDWEPGMSLTTEPVRRNGQLISSLDTEDLKLLVAMGLLVSTPSNHFLKHKFGGGHRATLHHNGVDDDDDDHGDEAEESTSAFPGADNEGPSEWETFQEQFGTDECTFSFDVDLEGVDDPNGDGTGCGGCGGCAGNLDYGGGAGGLDFGCSGGGNDPGGGAFFGAGCDVGTGFDVGDSGGGGGGDCGDCGGDGGGGCGGCGGCGG